MSLARKKLCEAVCRLRFSLNTLDINMIALYFLSQPRIMDVNVLKLRFETWRFSSDESDSLLVVTVKYMLMARVEADLFEGSAPPDQLSAGRRRG